MMNGNRMQVILVGAAEHEAKVWSALKPRIEAELAKQSGARVEIFDGKAIVDNRHYNWLKKKWRACSLQTTKLESRLRKDAVGASKMHPTVLVGYHHGANLIMRLLADLARNEELECLVQVRSAVLIDPKGPNPIAKAVMVFFVLACVSYFFAKFPGYIPFHPNGDAFLQRIKDASEYTSWFFALGLALLLALITKECGAYFGIDLSKTHHAKLAREFEDRISVGGLKDVAGKWPIPTSNINGLDLQRLDQLEIEGLTKAIVDPPGHQNVYEIDLYQGDHTLSPTQSCSAPGHEWGTEIEVTKVRFSPCDFGVEGRSVKPFEIRRRTNQGKITLLYAPEKNLWEPEERRAFDENGKFYVFRFRPTKAGVYDVGLSIEQGFGPGQMDFHMHPKPYVNYKKLVLTLDLRPMLQAGYHLLDPKPKAQFLSPQHLPLKNANDHSRTFHLLDCLGPKKDLQDHEHRIVNLDNLSTEEGLFRWEMEDVRNGGWIGYEYNLACQNG
jgi:hypothetical protein